VQVDPIKTTLKEPGPERLKLKLDEALSNVAFNLNLRRHIEVYEEVAKASMDNNLLKFSVKGYLLNAGICRLCSQDAIGAGPTLNPKP
jgi:hypothetical protein